MKNSNKKNINHFQKQIELNPNSPEFKPKSFIPKSIIKTMPPLIERKNIIKRDIPFLVENKYNNIVDSSNKIMSPNKVVSPNKVDSPNKVVSPKKEYKYSIKENKSLYRIKNIKHKINNISLLKNVINSNNNILCFSSDELNLLDRFNLNKFNEEEMNILALTDDCVYRCCYINLFNK